MKLLLQWIPLILFALGYYIKGFYFATIVIMIAMPIAFLLLWAYTKKIDIWMGVGALLILIFGGLTLYFHAPWFLKLKFSLIEGVIGLVFLISYYTKRPILDSLFPSIGLNSGKILTRNYGFFAIFISILNVIIWVWAPTEWWVIFKTFGSMILTIIFFALHYPYFTNKTQSK